MMMMTMKVENLIIHTVSMVLVEYHFHMINILNDNNYDKDDN
jgi:hypothetical protein